MRKNLMKQKLKAGEPVIGVFHNIQVPTAVEILGILGMDFVIIDAEHTAITPETAENLYRAAELRSISTVTRIGENSQQVIQKFLDAGSQGVIIPMVNNKEDALRVVDSTKYPPIGKRGLAASRSAEWGLTGSTVDYIKQANDEMLVAVQIETLEAVDNLKDILSVAEIDVVFIGPADLSTSMGLGGQATHPDALALIEKVGSEVRAAGKAAGTIARDADAYAYWRQRGFQWLCYSTSGLLANGARDEVTSLRQREDGLG